MEAIYSVGVNNLLAEILDQKHLNLSDPHSTFIVIGDIGAKVFFYYDTLESQWLLRHQSPLEVEERKAYWKTIVHKC